LKRNRKRSTRRVTKHNSCLVSLPNEILFMVARNLTTWDQKCLALTCKHLYDVICRYGVTTIHDVNQIEGGAEEFFLRLQTNWIPKNLKWCHHCGKFLSREKYFWDGVVAKYKMKIGGQIYAAWRYSIDRYIIQSLVFEWCDRKALRKNSAVKDCPKCAISKAGMACWGQGPTMSFWSTIPLQARLAML
jgi:hypothetical protein